MARNNWKNSTSNLPVLDDEDEIINTIVELNDTTFERVLKRCCDMERPYHILKHIINYWSKILKNQKKHLQSQYPRDHDSGIDFLAVTTKENKIVIAIRKMDDYKYTNVLCKCFKKSRSEEIFKDIIQFWGFLAKDSKSRQEIKESKSDRNNTNNIVVDGISDDRVELFEHHSTSSYSSRKLDKSLPIRIAQKRSTNIPPLPSKQSKLNYKPGSKIYCNQLFHEKFALIAEGIWTNDMEINWRVIENEETKLIKEIQSIGNRLSKNPEEHPKYADEWKEFWENKAKVVEDAGGNAEDYDYIPEWKEFWVHRMEALLHVEFNIRLDEIRKDYGMDFDTLNKIRMKKKEKKNELNELNQNDEFQPLDGNRSTRRPGNTVEKVQGGRGGPGLNQLRVVANPRPIVNRHMVKPKVGVDDCDIVQILRHMTILEGQLSHLAPEMLEFLKVAEHMELSGRGNCNVLLENQDFLTLLYKCRQKFQALVQANILPNDVKGVVNHSVQSLDIILESPKCKNILPNSRIKISGTSLRTPSSTLNETQSQSLNNMNRPRIPQLLKLSIPLPKSGTSLRTPSSTLVETQSQSLNNMNRPRIPELLKLSVPVPKNVSKPPPLLPAGDVSKPPPLLPVGDFGHPYNTNTECGRKQVTGAIMKRVEHLSIDQKESIADLLTITLVDDGKDEINDQELLEFIIQSLDPLVQSAEDQRSPPPTQHQRQSSSSISPNGRKQEEPELNDLPNKFQLHHCYYCGLRGHLTRTCTFPRIYYTRRNNTTRVKRLAH